MACAAPINYYVKFLVVTLIPPALLLVLGIVIYLPLWLLVRRFSF